MSSTSLVGDSSLPRFSLHLLFRGLDKVGSQYLFMAVKLHLINDFFCQRMQDIA